MADLFAIMKSACHGFVAHDTAGHGAFVARDVEHDSVAAGARHLDRNDAGRAQTFVTRMGVGGMATIASLGAWMRANERRRSTNDGRFLDGFTAGADNIVENRFETSIAATLVTRLLTRVFSALKLLVTRDATDVEAFGVGSVVIRGAATSVANMLAARLLTTASTLANELVRFVRDGAIQFAANHGLGARMAATRDLDIFDAFRALPSVTLCLAAMSA